MCVVPSRVCGRSASPCDVGKSRCLAKVKQACATRGSHSAWSLCKHQSHPSARHTNMRSRCTSPPTSQPCRSSCKVGHSFGRTQERTLIGGSARSPDCFLLCQCLFSRCHSGGRCTMLKGWSKALVLDGWVQIVRVPRSKSETWPSAKEERPPTARQANVAFSPCSSLSAQPSARASRCRGPRPSTPSRQCQVPIFKSCKGGSAHAIANCPMLWSLETPPQLRKWERWWVRARPRWVLSQQRGHWMAPADRL